MYDPSVLSTSGQKQINWPVALQAAVSVKKGTVITVSNHLSSYAIAPLPYLNFTSKSLGQDPDVVFVRGVNKCRLEGVMYWRLVQADTLLSVCNA
eukprot:18326-Heterococcus_DN1.PRE.2